MNALMKLDKGFNTLAKCAKKNAPAILTVLGVTGFVTTTIMAVKATPKAMDILDEVKKDIPEDMPKAKQAFIKVKAVAPVYAAPAIMGITSGLCIFKAYDISADRLAKVVTACEFKDEVLKEYQKKVIDTIGESKEREVRDEIAKDHIANVTVPEDVVAAETGQSLFIESITGQCFYSTRDDIWKAVRNFEKQLMLEDYCSCNEWFYELGLRNIGTDEYSIGEKLGFNSTEGIDIYFSVAPAPNGQPATVIEYRTPPTYDFCYKYR